MLLQISLSLMCVLLSGPLVQSQITYTKQFTHKLQKAGIEYAEPVEQWLHVILPPEDGLMDYDLVLQDDRNTIEYRYRISLPSDSRAQLPPSVAVTALIANLATNAEEAEILIQIPPDSLLQAAFLADAGIVARFIPRQEFSAKEHGALISMISEEGAVVDVVILYTDPEFDPLMAFRSVRFRE